MDHDAIAAAFDRWMDDFYNAPESFEELSAVARQHATERAAGQAPTYGQHAAATLEAYMAKGAA